MHFTQKFKMAAKMVEKQFSGKVASRLYVYPVGKKFVKIVLSCTVSEVNAFLHFTQKFKMASKNGGKTILPQVDIRLFRYP